MTQEFAHLSDVERLMRESLKLVSQKMSEQDRVDVTDYLDYGEYGAAYELLVFVLDKQKVSLPAQLIEAGAKMGFE